ncbi:MAG: ATP-dependent DNA helicase, partial [bacterium]
FKRAERKAWEADVIITNHWLLLMKRWDDPQDCSIVIDEAHNLEDAASDAFGSEVSKESFSTLLSLFLNKEGKRGILLRLRKSLGNVEELRTSFAIMRDFWQMLDEIGSALYSFFLSQKIIPHRVYGASLWMKRLDKRGEDEWAKVREILKKIQEAMERLEFSLDRLILMLSSKLSDLAEEMRNLQDNLIKMVGQLISLTSWDYEKNKMVRWIELELTEDAPEDIDMISPPPQYINWAIKEAPIRVDEYLRERIYERFRSVVLTSATLTVAGKGFSFFLDRLGLEDLVSDDDLLSLPPVYNYKENVLLLLPDYLSSDASHNNLEKFKEDVLEELRHFLSYVEGRSLVLFAARDRLEYVGERLESILGERMLPVYWQRRGVSKRHLLREFRDIEEATLLGLRSFWEGIDVPGPSLSYLILEKLPFPSLSEPLFQARREEVRRRGKDEYMDYLLPMTIIPFKQGFGRLIRQHEDRGVVIFLDKRLRSDTQSREIALGSLPGFKRSKEWEKSRKALYRAVSEHMKPLFSNFPWAEKLEKIEELTIKEIPKEKEEILWQEDILNNLKKGDFLLQTLNIAHLLSLLLKKGMRTIILSPSDPSYLLQSFNQPIPYIPAQPVLNISQFMRSWEEETSILALHPHWLADEEIRKLVRKADVLIITNPLQLHYSSTFFDPILKENLPQETRKIFLLPTMMEDALNLPPPFRDMPIVKSEEAPPIVFGRIEEIYPLLTKARENDKDVLIYSPDGEELEKRLNKMGFFASWGEDKLSLFQKDLLNILILPPGKRADKMGTSLIVHYPPMGDKLSYLLEASQAQLGGEVGYALSCFENEPSLKMLMESLFPDEEKDFQEFEALIKERKRVLLSLKTISAKFHRLIYLYSQSGKVEWQLVETMVDVILNKDVEDKRLKEILAKSKISPNKVKSLNLLEASRANGVSLEELSSALRRSLLRGELFYEIKAKAILVKAKDLNRKTIQPPVSRKEILEEWLELREWLYNKPPLELE